ncbi:MAG: hypothetical protein HY608_01110 [Planctomycetes bacterium]|nr:hypothetical protein [Planctomycetota bacterium]
MSELALAQDVLHHLPHRHAVFALMVASGTPQSRAYATAYDRMHDSTARSQGSKLAAKPNVQRAIERIHETIRASILQGYVENAGRALQTVLDIMNDERARPVDRLRAAQDILNRAGVGASQKVETSASRGPSAPVFSEPLAERIRRVDGMRKLLEARAPSKLDT